MATHSSGEGNSRSLRVEWLEQRRLLAGFQTEWIREIGGAPYATQVNATVVDELGNAYIGGWTTATLPGQVFAGVQDGFVRKYDQNGDELWTRQFGGESRDQVFGLALDESGLYVVGRADASLAGQTHLGGADAFLQRYDAAGNLAWTRQFGSTSFDLANSVAVECPRAAFQ